ncbi:MAG: heterocyst frequency control protein PatD [Spirulinaceae cyanobacterium SM2_1_0]|nr:heterocyst frequency control protein PatD [Spirulinaceae cyanobacterium SM2_1_0]
MLSSQHCARYQQFLVSLQVLQQTISNENAAKSTLNENFRQAKQVYQSEIVPLNSEGLEGAIASRWQSIQTELNRTFRLLQTDISFLQMARQSTTTQQRRASCQQQLTRLIAGCEAAIALGNH